MPDMLRQRLEAAAEGLLYTSESDRPFEWFLLPGGAAGWPYSVDEFARRAALAAGPLEERGLDRFFAPHIENTDPADTQTQALRPRYEALKEALRTELREVRVFRAGKIEVQCFVVGDDGAGSLAGLRTVAVET